MARLEIGPQEKRDRHLKVYVENSIMDAIEDHRKSRNLFSTSEAARSLLVEGIRASGISAI